MIKLLLLDSLPYFDTPYHLIGWLGWFIMAAMILWVLRQNWSINRGKRFVTHFVILGIATILSALFIGFDLPFNDKLPLPNIPRETVTPFVMIFSTLPLLLAGGLLGTWPAVVLGFLSGVLNALWNTHSVFSPLELSAIALMLSLALRQDFRTKFFRFLRRPIGASVFTALLTCPLFLISTFFSTNGSLAARLDYSFTQSWTLMAVYSIQIVTAGLLCELFSVHKFKSWVKFRNFRPSPIETGLQNRILYTALPMVSVLLITLVIADWVVAGRAAREIMASQLENSAKIAADNIPSILETGQSLTSSLVNLDLPLNDREQIQRVLRGKIREIPFFNQLFVFDLTGAPITGYPSTTLDQFRLSSEEQAGIQLALNGVMIQSYVIPPNPGGDSAMISFIAAIPDEYGLAKGVVISRTSFSINLFSQPAILALENIKEAGGQGAILDESNRILFDTNPNLVMSFYEGQIPETSGYMEDAGATGTRQMLYAAIDTDKGWKVILSLPASYSQELALRIAVPLLVISLAISFLAFLLLRFMMKALTSSLVNLAARADQISKGELEHTIDSQGVDEIGRLGTAFEQMRVSLKSRLEELDTLLNVSQGIASSLNLESASGYLLKALRSYGADAASLIVVKNPGEGVEDDFQVFRSGTDAEAFAGLDKVLPEALKEENILIIPSKARIKRMGLPKNAPLPAALAAIAVFNEDQLTGFLWAVYTEPHRFMVPEVRFLNTLAGQAAMAVNNSTLYMKAEVGKRRLESVLASTPEPVLVASDTGKVLIANEAARQKTEMIRMDGRFEVETGEILSEKLSVFLSKCKRGENKDEEIELEDGHTYLVSISPVEVENSLVGKVCVLSDVTDYKALEKMKSEYVSTVSHDLKAPLGLIRGYASMLQMVGELNEQQRDYLSKILDGIDEISHMTDNLLDMRRIDSGIELQLEKFVPADLIDQVISEVQPQIKNRKVQVLRELTFAQDVAIEADKALLQRAIYNLMENAVKFSPIGGQVNLGLEVNDKSVIFKIQDHGPGIAPLDIPTIFERKRAADNNKGKNQQREAGIGLSIVKSIAERHRGKVWVESILGKGCTFYLEVPIGQKGKTRKKLDV